MTTANIFALTDTWNNGATTFAAIQMNVTDTSSNAASLLMDLQVAGSSKFNVTKTGYANASIGTNAAPAYGFIGETNTGFYKAAARVAAVTVNGNSITGWSDNGGNVFRINGNLEFTTAVGNSGDTILVRDAAANTLALRNSTNAQTFRVYNTYTDASNYERGALSYVANVLQIGHQIAGTGATRDVKYYGQGHYFHTTAGSARWGIDANGHLIAGPLGGADNTYDIGATGATRPRNVYVAAAAFVNQATAIPAGGTAGAGINVSSTANFGVYFGSGAPTLSAAKGSLYLRSDGSTTNDRMYVNTNGTTTWTAVTTVA